MGYDYGKIWVAGASGRVGTMIHNMLDMRDVELFETDIEELDITNANEVNLFGLRNRPNTIINCAGLTDVRACEENMELAYKVNALGARNLSAVARKIDARIIQISTDDIFWDKKENRFHEFDTPNPRTVYGKSKLAGENFVKELAPKHLIIRSSWVYGKEGDNFVNSIIAKTKSGQKIEAAVDDYACPTSAKELSRVILRRSGRAGRHLPCSMRRILQPLYAGPGNCKAYRQGRCGAGSGENGEVHPSLDGPEYTILDNMMLRMCEIQAPVSWQEALAEYIADCFPENRDINRNERKGRGM